jgi:hypothetical protein
MPAVHLGFDLTDMSKHLLESHNASTEKPPLPVFDLASKKLRE